MLRIRGDCHGDELSPIVDLDHLPTIDPIFGPTPPFGYRSVTSDAGHPLGAWLVYFHDGDRFPCGKAVGLPVRAVRGDP